MNVERNVKSVRQTNILLFRIRDITEKGIKIEKVKK